MSNQIQNLQELQNIQSTGSVGIDDTFFLIQDNNDLILQDDGYFIIYKE